jgi:diguanylate cyclase (GGDEF)-like protein/PAS domain S-box-containing protein
MCLNRVNPAFARERGYTVGEMQGMAIGTIFPEEHQTEVIEQVKQAERLGHASFESVQVRKDGSRFPVWIELSVAHDEQGNPLYRAANVQDITERKLAELEREQLLHVMGDRVKELQCMYGITEAIRIHDSMDEIFLAIIKILPTGWRYPEYATARICFDDEEFTEIPFQPTAWKQSANLMVQGDCRGSVEIYYTKTLPDLDEGPFLVEERNLIDGVAKILSGAIERKQVEAELQYLATHDTLTGLNNRSVLEQQASDEVHRAERYDRALSLFLVDIDHFKQINDRFSHQVGDSVLSGFAKILEHSVRRTDHAARYGGEEFVILLPETTLAEAKELAERLRIRISEHPIALEDGEAINITISLGVATFPEHAASWQNLLKAADAAMYDAKSDGRNCVRVAKSTT